MARRRRSFASATAISCSISPIRSEIVVRSAIAIGGSIEASTSPFATACPIRGKALLRGDHPSAGDALDEAAAVGIGDDAADENLGLRHGFGLRDHGADIENALRRFRHEDLAVRQSPCRVARCRERLGVPVDFMSFVSASHMVRSRNGERGHQQCEDRHGVNVRAAHPNAALHDPNARAVHQNTKNKSDKQR